MVNTPALIRKRIILLFVLMALALAAIVTRLFWLQLVRGEELQKWATENRMQDVPVRAKRGTIYDRNGREMAISVSSDSVYAIPNEVVASGREQEIARELARILEMKPEKVLEIITRESRFEWVMRQIDDDQAEAIRKLELPGIDFAEESRRYYPKKNLASHILGIVGVDNIGLEGIEVTWEKELGGLDGRVVIEHDAYGLEIPQAMHKYIPPVEGHDLVLTIDETIQYIAERELDKLCQEHNPDRASIVVMDPHTGEILALANRPDFDPNNYNDYPAVNRRNHAVSNAFEPGSVFKIVTGSAALEEGVVRPDTIIDDPGGVRIGPDTISCGGAHGSQTFREVVANSCNVGFAKIGLSMGAARLFKYIKGFGFGRQTGIDLPGEATGILVPENEAKPIDLGTMAIGQANAITAIQLTRAAAAIANGGLLLKPQLVKEVRQHDGEVIQRFEPVVERRIISAETAREMRIALEGVVTTGTGKNAYIEGYRCAGKTGTAQKPSPYGGYSASEYIGSFIGFAPADDPKLVILVTVDNPKGGMYYGGWVAAPVWREVMRDSLRYLQVPPQYDPNAAKTGTGTDKKDTKEVVVPSVINLPLAEAQRVLRAAGLVALTEGEGPVVWGQTPAASAKVPPETKVILYTGPEEQVNENTQQVTVPDLTGKTFREAAEILATLGLGFNPVGSGIAVNQDHKPGTTVKAGTAITVEFRSPAERGQVAE